ncbi:MAG: hypothetical protein K2X77_25530 [Candidatus Obscuribacterales bacterium]|nr:hypothetical protein [Candidatus Obscuribacterales bacterium]
MSKKTDRNLELWEQAKAANTLELVRILALLKERSWVPKVPAEREWFDELLNLCAPCKLESISENGDQLLWDRDSVEVIRLVSPFVSAGNYSIHLYKNEFLLTHCPASSGLVEVWSIPKCEQKFQLKLYSRRSAFHLSNDSSILVSYTDKNTIAVDSFPDYQRLCEWEHPHMNDGNSFRIEVLTDSNEIIATDLTGGIYFLKAAPRFLPKVDDSLSDFTVASGDSLGVRKFEKVLPRRQALLAAAKNGRYMLIPSFDLTNAVVWSFPDCKRIARIDGTGTSEITFLSAAFSPDSQFLIATGVNELQVRSEPFTDVLFTIKLGLGNNLPVFAVSPNSKRIAVLPRSNPAQIHVYELSSGNLLNCLKLPAFFARFPVYELRFTPDCEHLLLTGTEHVYLVKVSGESFAEERKVIRSRVDKRIRDLKDEDIKELDSLYGSRWISSQMRPWIDMMMYLHNRRSVNDIELEDAQFDQFEAYDIELEDAK